MWSALQHAAGAYRRLVSVRLRGQLQYRVPFLLDVAASAISVGIGFTATALIFDRFETIGGWSLGEVAFLYGLIAIGFGLVETFLGGFSPGTFSTLVQRGTLDQILLRPVSTTLQILASDLVLRRLTRVVQGIAALSISLSVLDVRWTVARAAYLPVVVASIAAFFSGLFIIGSTTTFWTVQRLEVINVFTYGGSEMMAYPMHIYAGWMRRFFTYVVPAIFVSYCPALYLLDKPDPLGMPSWTAFVAPPAGFGTLAVALAFWRIGLHHYTSTGT
jgi:ABC-2 type transport system permease protein